MAWLESHQELAGHPKTKRFARSADICIPRAIGHLHLLWWWCMDYAQDGNLSQWEASDIADAVHWTNEPEKLLKFLIDARFIDNIDGQLFIHDWNDYVGKLMETRRKDRERKRKSETLRRNSNGIQAESAVTQPNPTQPTKPNTTNTQPNQPNHVAGSVVLEEEKRGKEGITGKAETSWLNFWSNYPKKTCETEAREAWFSLNIDNVVVNKIFRALEDAKSSTQWTKENGKYIPKAVNWLNKKSWEDEENDAILQNNAATGFSPEGLSGFHNALDKYDDEGKEITVTDE